MAPWWLSASDDEAISEPLDEVDDETLALEAEPAPAALDSAVLSKTDDSETGNGAPKPARRKRRRKRRRRPARRTEAAPESSKSGHHKSSQAGHSGEARPSAAPPAAPPVAATTEPVTPPAAVPTQWPVARPEEAAFDPTRNIVYALPEAASAADERKIAMLVDLENVALGVRDSEIKKLDVTLILERLLEKGKIIVKKAYADWERYSDFKRPFHEAAIELIDIPQKYYSGKNSADIKMVVDAMDLCYSKEHLDTFALISGDSDFSPLASKLKENNKFVIGIGVRNSSSNLLIDNCDEFIFYEDVWRVAHRGPGLDYLSPKDAEVFGLMSDAMVALIRENKDVLWGSMIKQTMQRKRPSFNESYYGYGSFSELLEDAQRKGIIGLKRNERSGSYVVTGFAER